jgi:geranylgeranyl diphosphate synthase type I
MSASAYVERYLPLVEAEMRDLLPMQGALSVYYGMMQYHLGWLDSALRPSRAAQGKRLRPVLCLMACEAVGGRVAHALPAAAAIELVHNFSLIHDDIEDASPTRRHRETVWRIWGVPQAINCGDGLYTVAYLKLGQLSARGVPLHRALTAQRLLAETCLALTEGQYMDMSFEDEAEIDLDRYLSMIRRKSATLIASSTQLGAYLGGGDPQAVDAYREFGLNLGMAFQVIDDILGIWGTEEVTGKSAATDVLSRKKTLPVVFALGDPALQALYAREQLGEEDVPAVIEILERAGARAYAEGMARSYSEQALGHLARAGIDTPAHREMGELAGSLLERER